MRPSELPLRYKVAMIAVYLVGTLAIFFTVSFVFRDLLPPVLAAILGAGLFGFVLGYGFRDLRSAPATPAATSAAAHGTNRPEMLDSGNRRLRQSSRVVIR